ncbi:hypothetical protein KRMM14A1004_62530 [Krasilnikovia sp. MM14-A1004]
MLVSPALFAYRIEGAKTGQGGESFGTVSLFSRASTGSGESADHPAGERPPRCAQVVDNLWTAGGAVQVQHVMNVLGWGSRSAARVGDDGQRRIAGQGTGTSGAMGVARRWPIRST